MGRDFEDTCHSPSNSTDLKNIKHNFMTKIIFLRDRERFSSMRMFLEQFQRRFFKKFLT